tara:strand:+ start:3105 stop:3233 length:129 start_codon:yes stop_codon:yes gene_type:complete
MFIANAAELTSVTGAVRSYTASASQEEKDKKYGQQVHIFIYL